MYIVKLENVNNNSQDINIKEGDYISICCCHENQKDDFLWLGTCRFIDEALYLLEDICRTNGFNARLVSGNHGNALYEVMKNR